MSGAAKEGLFNVSKAQVLERVLSADFTTDFLESRHCRSGSVWVVWKDGSATDAVVKLQQGPTENGPWQDLASATATLDASGATERAKKISVSDVDSPYLRAVATKNTESTAKVTLRYYFKGA